MKTGFVAVTAKVVIIFFLFFLFTPNNYTVPQSEKEGLKKIKEVEKPKKQVLEKPGKKKIKKKSSILPIVGGVLALGALAFLLIKKKDSGDSGSGSASLHIESTPSGADVYVDGANKGITTPCDITVSEGSSEIKLVIDRWGEASDSRSFSDGSIYNLNVKLAAYIYKPVTSFDLDGDGITFGYQHCDGEGNIYLPGNRLLNKYDRDGVKIYSITRNFFTHFPYITINENKQRIYLMTFTSPSNYEYNITDPDGNFITKYKNLPSYNLDFDMDGNHYIINRGSLEIYDSNMVRTGEIVLDNSHSYKKIRISDDNEHFFIGNPLDRSINKYKLTGEFVRKWFGGDTFHGTLICTYGTGDRERVYLGTGFQEGQKIEIYTGGGEFLTSTNNNKDIRWMYSDNNGNIFVDSGGNNVTRYEPSSETGGSGTWTVQSKLKRSDTKGSLNGLSNNLRLQKRVDRDAIKKELKDKKEGKKIR